MTAHTEGSGATGLGKLALHFGAQGLAIGASGSLSLHDLHDRTREAG